MQRICSQRAVTDSVFHEDAQRITVVDAVDDADHVRVSVQCCAHLELQMESKRFRNKME